MTPRDLTQSRANGANWLMLEDLDCVPAAADPARLGEVRDWLKACAAFGDMSSTGYLLSNGANCDGWMGEGCWLARALAAYRMIRPRISAADRLLLDGWFLRNAQFHSGHAQWWISKVFPARANDDYSVRTQSALTGSTTGRLLYRDGQAISNLSQAWQNRLSNAVLFFGLAGAWLGDADLVAQAKRYVREWVTYSVWPDGAQGEWQRADEYGNPGQGLTYGAHNIATALILASEFAAIGDTELLTWRTNGGLWGTESPLQPKTIWTAFDMHVSLLAGARKLVTDKGNAVDPWTSTSGRPGQPSWFIPVAKRWCRGSMLDQWVATPSSKTDDPFGPWRGMAGMYLDVRTA